MSRQSGDDIHIIGATTFFLNRGPDKSKSGPDIHHSGEVKSSQFELRKIDKL